MIAYILQDLANEDLTSPLSNNIIDCLSIEINKSIPLTLLISSAVVVQFRTRVQTRTWTDGTQVRTVAGTEPDIQFRVQSSRKYIEHVRTGLNLSEPEEINQVR